MPLSKMEVQMYPDGRMDPKNTSRYLGLSVKTLAMYRSKGGGPRFVKCGRIFYYQEDLDKWIHSHGRCETTAQAYCAKHTQPLTEL